MLCLCAHWTGTSLRRSEQPKHGILQYPIDGAYIPIKSEKDIQRLLDCFNDLLNKGVCPTKIFIDPEITIPGPRHWDLPLCQTRFLTFNKNDKASFENFKPTAVHAMLFGWFNNMRYFKADVIQIVPADVRNRLRVNFHNILQRCFDPEGSHAVFSAGGKEGEGYSLYHLAIPPRIHKIAEYGFMSIGDKEVKKEAETLRLLVSINKDALFKLSTWSTDDIVDKSGKGFVPTPLAKAIDTLNVECTRILIEEAKVPISHPVSIFFLGRFQTITFNTALEHILLNDEVSFNAYSLSEDDGALKLELLQYLLAHGADPNQKCGNLFLEKILVKGEKKWETPREKVVETGHGDNLLYNYLSNYIVDSMGCVMLKLDYDCSFSNINFEKFKISSSKDIPVTHFPLGERQKNHFECVKLLLKHGANPNALCHVAGNLEGKYPLQAAPTPMLTRLLLDFGADPNLVDPSGQYPLLYHMQKGNTKMMELLIDRGADVNLKSIDFAGFQTDKKTRKLTKCYANIPKLAYTAVDDMKPEVLQLLIERGVNLNVYGHVYYNARKTPMWRAKENLVIERGTGYESRAKEIYKILKDAGAQLRPPGFLNCIRRPVDRFRLRPSRAQRSVGKWVAHELLG